MPNPRVVPLAELRPGHSAAVAGLIAGRRLARRLTEQLVGVSGERRLLRVDLHQVRRVPQGDQRQGGGRFHDGRGADHQHRAAAR
jgi:hypothetical protein